MAQVTGPTRFDPIPTRPYISEPGSSPVVGTVAAAEPLLDVAEPHVKAAERPSSGPAQETASTKQLVKLTVNLGVEVYSALKQLSTKRGSTVTECLRHAISTERWLQERRDRGDKILVQNRQGQLYEVVFR